MKTEKRIEEFKKKEGREPGAFELCPRFEKCNRNKCPLHPDYLKLNEESEDYSVIHKEKCAPKRVRKEIGTYLKLKNNGLTSREISSSKKWAEMPESEKLARKQKLIQFSPISRLKAKGYGIVRVRKKEPKLTQLNNDISAVDNSKEQVSEPIEVRKDE